MLYFNILTREYGLSWQDARNKSPNVSAPQGSPFFGEFVGYVDVNPPAHDPVTQTVRELPPIEGDGTWTQRWEIVELSDEVATENATRVNAELEDLIADQRYNAEIGGFDFNGLTVRSDRESQGLITGAALSALLDPSYVCRWKTPTGFIELNAEQTIGLARAVRIHVQSCFNREEELVNQVRSGTYVPGTVF